MTSGRTVTNTADLNDTWFLNIPSTTAYDLSTPSNGSQTEDLTPLDLANKSLQILLNYQLPTEMGLVCDIMALCTTFLMVLGFCTNTLCIFVFGTPLFRRMAFSVHMKILCLLNIAVLMLGVLQHHSFFMDMRPMDGAKGESRRYFCTYLLWFNLVFRHTRTCCIILVAYNRLKAQSEPDYFQKTIQAARFPILANVFCLVVSTIFVSRYIDRADISTEQNNRTECSFLFMHPFYEDVTSYTIMSNLPLAEHSIALLVLAIFLVKLIPRSHKNKSITQGMSMSQVGAENSLLRMKSEAPSWSLVQRKIRRASEPSKQISMACSMAAMEFKESIRPNMSDTTYYEKDFEVNAMTAVIVVVNVLISGLRDSPDILLLIRFNPRVEQKLNKFSAKAYLDLAFFIYLACMFFLMCLTSRQFLNATYNLIIGVKADRLGTSHSSLFRAPAGSGSRVVRATSIVPIDPSDSAPGTRRSRPFSTSRSDSFTNKEYTEFKKDNEYLVTSSVWSIDRAYFLNNMKQQAILEKF